MGKEDAEKPAKGRLPSSKAIRTFNHAIIQWGTANLRNFPWRKANVSDYRLIVTEVLLQRTRAEIVANFYSTFFAHYPSWSSLDRAPLDEVEESLRPVGLYKQRAKALKRLAARIAPRNGRFPSTRENLDKLPAVGQYIGNAIELFVFGRPVPLIDANMSRLLERYFGERKLVDIRYDPYLQELAHTVTTLAGDPVKLNWALLDYASLICTAHNPVCEQCVLSSRCKSFNASFLEE